MTKVILIVVNSEDGDCSPHIECCWTEEEKESNPHAFKASYTDAQRTYGKQNVGLMKCTLPHALTTVFVKTQHPKRPLPS